MSWEPFTGSSRERSETGAAPAPAPAPASAPAAYLDPPPRRGLAVLTCMDGRLDPLADLDLQRGDAVVLRNGGATFSDDMERSLRVAIERLGVRELWVVGHSDCVAHGRDIDVILLAVRDGVRRAAAALPLLSVQGRLYDHATGAVEPVS